jgi:hypothetical protein
MKVTDDLLVGKIPLHVCACVPQKHGFMHTCMYVGENLHVYRHMEKHDMIVVYYACIGEPVYKHMGVFCDVFTCFFVRAYMHVRLGNTCTCAEVLIDTFAGVYARH